MSENENRLYVYVLGNKGKCGYIITNTDSNELHRSVHANLVNDLNKPLHQVHTDWVAMIKSLEYIRDNLGKNNIPSAPVVYVFTKYETNYWLTAEKHPVKSPILKKYMKEIQKLKIDLKRGLQLGESDNNIEFHFLPDNFVNKMNDVQGLLDYDQIKKRPRRP